MSAGMQCSCRCILFLMMPFDKLNVLQAPHVAEYCQSSLRSCWSGYYSISMLIVS